MKRRDFLLARSSARPAHAARDRGGEVELSCERLFMRFVDAEVDGTTARLFDILARDLQSARVVRLTERSWLARADFKSRVDKILAAFVAGGGRLA